MVLYSPSVSFPVGDGYFQLSNRNAWGEGTSVEKMPPPDFPITHPWDHFENC